MAETLVKNPICSKCGEDARPKAQFCFACGGEIVGNEDDPDLSEAWFKHEIVEGDGKDSEDDGAAAGKTESEPETAEDSETETEAGESKVVTVKRKKTADPEKDQEADGERSLKSAAQLRRRPKPIRSRQVEVVWKEKTESPNWLFLVFGSIFVVISAVLFFLAIYLK